LEKRLWNALRWSLSEMDMEEARKE
jgi:hypothetical protein